MADTLGELRRKAAACRSRITFLNGEIRGWGRIINNPKTTPGRRASVQSKLLESKKELKSMKERLAELTTQIKKLTSSDEEDPS